ncbi:hypothetical protein ACWEOE_28810 [Amycolatopsis sp. NPDC004368]
MRRQAFISREFVEGRVSAKTPDGVPVDPSTLVVAFAFMAGQLEPGDADWHSAEHLRDDVYGVLVGPGALVLARGEYTTWCRPDDVTERPAAPFGTLTIF